MSDFASLLERLRGPHRRSECGNFAEVHPDCLTEAADRISTLERELEDARATARSALQSTPTSDCS